MGKVKRLELWWQLYRKSLPVWDLENFRPMDFCSTEYSIRLTVKHVHPVLILGKRQNKKLNAEKGNCEPTARSCRNSKSWAWVRSMYCVRCIWRREHCDVNRDCRDGRLLWARDIFWPAEHLPTPKDGLSSVQLHTNRIHHTTEQSPLVFLKDQPKPEAL